jgi:hypothetical protein
MPRAIDDTQRWRDRAEEMRTLSYAMRSPENIEIMLRLAEDYDTMADRAESGSRDGMSAGE